MKKVLLVIFTILLSTTGFAQVGIGTSTPDASAALDITATDKGVLIPRMTTAQRTAIAAPALGLMVFDTDTKTNWSFNGTLWQQSSGGTGKFVDGVTPDIAYYEGKVGIGINAFGDVFKLNVVGKKSTDAQNNVVNIVGIFEGTGTSLSTYASAHSVFNTGTGTIFYGIGTRSTISNGSTGTISNSDAIRPEINNEGDMDTTVGSSININNNGTITNAYGEFINYFGTGTVTNSYGLFISNTFNQGTGFNYSIYSASDADSFFEGNLGVGINTPQQKVHISGVLRLEPQTTTPVGDKGDLYVSDNGALFFHNGTEWKEVSLL